MDARVASLMLGVLGGLGLAIALPALRPAAPVWDAVPIRGELLDEADGPIERIAFAYVPEDEPLFEEALRAFLPSLDPSTELVAVVSPGRPGADPALPLRAFLRRLAGGDALAARTRVVVAGAPISPWAKDRALVASGRPTELLVPARPGGPGERRRADWHTPLELAGALPEELHATVLPLDFDAGDVAASGGRVLVDANLVAKNAARGLGSPARLAEALGRLFHAPVTVLGERPGDVPRHHLSMVLAPLDRGVVLVGDPRLARPIVGEGFTPGERSPETSRPLVADFSAQTIARHDRAAADLAAAGFRVVRIPTVPFDDKTYLAYTNGVFEVRGGRRIAWMPVFGIPALDRAAAEVYQGQGWEVRPVPGRAAFPYHGTIGCLVNVLGRGPRP
jgi:hypothetical protein